MKLLAGLFVWLLLLNVAFAVEDPQVFFTNNSVFIEFDEEVTVIGVEVDGEPSRLFSDDGEKYRLSVANHSSGMHTLEFEADERSFSYPFNVAVPGGGLALPGMDLDLLVVLPVLVLIGGAAYAFFAFRKKKKVRKAVDRKVHILRKAAPEPEPRKEEIAAKFVKTTSHGEMLAVYDQMFRFIKRDLGQLKSRGVYVEDLEERLRELSEDRIQLVYAQRTGDGAKCSQIINSLMLFMHLVEERKKAPRSTITATLPAGTGARGSIKEFDEKLSKIESSLDELEKRGVKVSDLRLAFIELKSKSEEIESAKAQFERDAIISIADDFINTIEQRMPGKKKVPAPGEEEEEEEEVKIPRAAQETKIGKPEILDIRKGEPLPKPKPMKEGVVKALHSSMFRREIDEALQNDVCKFFDKTVDSAAEVIKELDKRGVSTSGLTKSFHGMRARRGDLKKALEEGDESEIRTILNALEEFTLLIKEKKDKVLRKR